MHVTRDESNQINHIHERVLRIIYDDCTSTFEELLEKDGAVSIPVRDKRKVAIEMYQVFHGIAPEVINDVFRIVEESMLGRQFVRKRDITVFSWRDVILVVWARLCGMKCCRRILKRALHKKRDTSVQHICV